MNILYHSLSWLAAGFFWLAAAGSLSAQDSASPQRGYVNFSFDQVDIGLVVKRVGDLTGKLFVLDEQVKGKISIVTPPNTRVEDIYALFVSSLHVAGYSVVEKEKVHHIVKLPNHAIRGAAVFGPDQEVNIKGLVTKIFALKGISVLELKKVVEPLVGGGTEGALMALGSSNHLIVTDTDESIKRLGAIIKELDSEEGARNVEVIPLKHALAGQVAKQVMQALVGTEQAGASLMRHARQVAAGGAHLPSGATVIPAEHASCLIVAGTPVQIAELKRIITLLDVEPQTVKGNLHAIFLRYMDAEDAATSLNNLLAKSDKKESFQHIAIEAVPANKALLVDASPANFAMVSNLVSKLDYPPKQVLVELLIAELSSGKELELGVEWATIDVPEAGSTTFIGRQRLGDANLIGGLLTNSMFPQGLNMAWARGTFLNANGVEVPRIPAFIRALAQDRDVEILSNVPLLAQDNKEASVSVVDNIPVRTSTIQGTGNTRDVIQNIERMDVGIKLVFTPHVNPDNEILLELNPSIEAVVDNGPAGSFSPTIAKRDVKTVVTVPDEATIIISGLIREDIIKGESKIPLLGDIPWLGNLFKSTSDRKQKTNLLIFVTPRIVDAPGEADSIRDALHKKSGLNLKAATAAPPSDDEE